MARELGEMWTSQSLEEIGGGRQMCSKSLEPTDNLLRGLETDRPSAGIMLPREPLRLRYLILATLVRIHRLMTKGADHFRSRPLKCHRCAVGHLINPQRLFANSESLHSLLVQFHIEQIENVPPD